jgi:hypothetical protein
VKASLEELIRLFDQHDSALNLEGSGLAQDIKPLVQALDEYFLSRESARAVVGVDIYQYSRLDSARQRLVPAVFALLHQVALELCWERETFLFKTETREGHFISTGDGGYQMLSTPLHAVVFALYLELAFSAFNAYLHYPRVRAAIGPISVRYAITFDKIFEQDGNFFGTAIINNARILSRDSLNRCLMDGASLEWFRSQIGTVETLLISSSEGIAQLPAFAHYHDRTYTRSMLFRSTDEGLGSSPVRTVNVQKIGLVAAKQSQIDIHNLHIQVVFTRSGDAAVPEHPMVVSLGNLNSAGISD